MSFFNKTSLKDWLENLISTTEISEEALQAIAEQSAIEEMALYTAVGLIADIISRCERQVYENGKTVKNGDWYVWNVSPNPNQTASQLISEWIINLYYKGEALMVPLSGNVYVASSFARDEYPVKGDVFRSIAIDTYQIRRTYRANNAYYLRLDTPQVKNLIDKTFKNYSYLLKYSQEGASQTGEKYELQLGAFPSGDEKKQDAYLEKVKDNLSSFVNAHAAVFPATKDQKLTRLSAATSGASSDYTALRKDVYSIVASAMHLPVGLLDGNITSVDQVLNQALTLAIDPLAAKISEELTRKTFKREEILNGCRIKVDTTCIKHIDAADIADKLDKLVASGLMCIDEVRTRCNLPELLTDWSQKHFITKNYEGIEEAGASEGGE